MSVWLASDLGRSHEFEALVDTGFDGTIILPEGSISQGLPPHGESRWRLADNSVVSTSYYLVQAEIAGTERPFSLLAYVLGKEAIIGRALTNNFRITLDHGERIIVEP